MRIASLSCNVVRICKAVEWFFLIWILRCKCIVRSLAAKKISGDCVEKYSLIHGAKKIYTTTEKLAKKILKRPDFQSFETSFAERCELLKLSRVF